jgi:hypothetical protein
MANLIGAGLATWSVLPERRVSVDAPPPVRAFVPRPVPVVEDRPEISALLERVTGLLETTAEGITALELRRMLEASPDALQLALAAGVRRQLLRRTGARGHMRYLLNRP